MIGKKARVTQWRSSSSSRSIIVVVVVVVVVTLLEFAMREKGEKRRRFTKGSCGFRSTSGTSTSTSSSSSSSGSGH